MTDERHSPRHERQPKPVKLSRAPWESAGAGNTADNAPTQPKTQDARSEAQKTAFAQFMALAWPWVLDGSPEWLNLRAAFDAGWRAKG